MGSLPSDATVNRGGETRTPSVQAMHASTQGASWRDAQRPPYTPCATRYLPCFMGPWYTIDLVSTGSRTVEPETPR